jgi:DNA-binding GntR family transcriptional regulator
MKGQAGDFTLSTASLIDVLSDAVRKRIINGQIAPGEKLTEARIAAEYSVARTTAKACLERLTTLGLLRRSAHKTAVVPELDRSELLDLFFSRFAVERCAVTTLAGDGRVPPEALRAQTAIEVAAKEMNFEQQVEADIAFHSSLVDAVGSRRLSKMHELIMGEVHLTMGQFQAHRATHPNKVALEHAAILAAIEACDPAAAEQALAVHLRAAENRLLARLSRLKSDVGDHEAAGRG